MSIGVVTKPADLGVRGAGMDDPASVGPSGGAISDFLESMGDCVFPPTPPYPVLQVLTVVAKRMKLFVEVPFLHSVLQCGPRRRRWRGSRSR